MVIEIDKRNKTVVLSLGGNVGDVKQSFLASIKYLENEVGDLMLSSSLYTSKAWGVENQPDFINQVIVLNTNLTPSEVLKVCLNIEQKLGRNRVNQVKWKERPIDIDVLFYQDEIIDTNELKIPHPYIQERNFVLFPLAEIIPNYIHPILGKSVQELKKNSEDNLLVTKIID